jgi:hypothetical protein
MAAVTKKEGGGVGHKFERDPHKNHSCQVWCNLVQRFQRRRFKCDLLSKYAQFAYKRSHLNLLL